MYDISPYESTHPNRLEQASNIALGKIIEVDIKKRTCTVATITGRGSVFDQYISNVQWLCSDVNPEGDESGSIPRRGSWGICYFLDGQVFIGGYTRPIGDKASTVRGNEAATLNEGDKIMSTLAGNRLTIKRSGLIELFANEGLKIMLLPTMSQLIQHCRTYNFKSDGGTIDWRTDKLLNTLWKAEYYSNVARLFTLEEKKGFVSSSLIYRKVIGPAIPGTPGSQLPVYTKTIGISGETITTVSPPLPAGSPSGYKSTIGPDGSIEILAGAAQTVTATVSATGATQIDVNKLFNLSITEFGDLDIAGPVGTAMMNKLGDIQAANAAGSIKISNTGDVEAKGPIASLSMTKAGEITIKNATVSITISTSGEVTVKAANKVTLDAKAGVDIKSLGPVNIEGVGPMNIKTKGVVKIDGGTGASDFVLTNPTTLSPFTGAPLVPFSTTVMVSK